MTQLLANAVSRPRYLHKGYMTPLRDIPESERLTIQPQHNDWLEKPMPYKSTLPKAASQPMNCLHHRWEAEQLLKSLRQ